MILNGKEVNPMETLQTDYVDCFCKSVDHVLRFSIYTGKECVDFFIEGNFQPNFKFWKRLRIGFGYIFSRKWNVPYTSTEFNLKEAEQIKWIAEKYIHLYKVYEQKELEKEETITPLRK